MSSDLAFSVRSAFQKALFSFIILLMKLSADIFQYTSYVFGMNSAGMVALLYPIESIKLLSLSNVIMLVESAIICPEILDANLSIVLTLGTTSLTGVCHPAFSVRKASSAVVSELILYAPVNILLSYPLTFANNFMPAMLSGCRFASIFANTESALSSSSI